MLRLGLRFYFLALADASGCGSAATSLLCRRNIDAPVHLPYDGSMAKEPSIEEAVERARRAQEDRISAIRLVGEARQSLADVREETARELAELQAQIAKRVSDAEREDVKAFNAAITAGWSVEELRKIGYAEPDKKVRARRRSTRKTGPKSAAQTDSVSNEKDAPQGVEESSSGS